MKCNVRKITVSRLEKFNTLRQANPVVGVDFIDGEAFQKNENRDQCNFTNNVLLTKKMLIKIHEIDLIIMTKICSFKKFSKEISAVK